MDDLIRRLKALKSEIDSATSNLGLSDDIAKLERLQLEVAEPGFWSDPQAAGDTSQRLAMLEKHVEGWTGLSRDTSEALEMAQTLSGDDIEIMRPDLESAYERARSDFDVRSFELKLNGPHDKASAIIELHAGTGGTDAQDWTEMLERMYLRYAERAGFKTDVVSVSRGEEAGIKSVTFEVDGQYAYGKLKGEAGTHRLVRLSPFNSDNLRQTSFALVEVLPKLEGKSELEIDPKDLRIDVYRSGGNGGQSVNTTDSAVRITHVPTGTVVAIQNERSQLQNKEKAMAILKARLGAMLEEQAKAELGELRSGDRSAAWGQQIRNYVLHPYTKVKDVRTSYETAQAQDVLDGELEGFIEAYLSQQIAQ